MNNTDAIETESEKLCEDYLTPDWGKWPRLLVRGKAVKSREDVLEVLVRTTPFDTLFSNDREQLDKVRALVGLRETYGKGMTPEQFNDLWAHNNKVIDDLQILPLNHLSNSRVLTASITGPHGWLDWNGNVGCANYNIGKWPSTQAVVRDLLHLAKAFTFLDFKVQLLADEGDGDVCLSAHVHDGEVEMLPFKDAEPLNMVVGLSDADIFACVTRGTTREHGVSLEVLEEALEVTRERLAQRS